MAVTSRAGPAGRTRGTTGTRTARSTAAPVTTTPATTVTTVTTTPATTATVTPVTTDAPTRRVRRWPGLTATGTATATVGERAALLSAGAGTRAPDVTVWTAAVDVCDDWSDKHNRVIPVQPQASDRAQHRR